MLILTRKVGEAVVVGRDVKITVLHAKGSQVRLGIDAPPSVPVHREEIFTRIHSVESTQVGVTQVGVTQVELTQTETVLPKE